MSAVEVAPVTWERNPRGWWERFIDGARDGDSRFTKPVDYTQSCTHSEQGHNVVCAWCGGTVAAVRAAVDKVQRGRAS